MNKINFDKNQLDSILEVVQEAIRDLPGGSGFDPYDEELMEADPDVRPLFGDFTTTCEPD